MSTVKRRPLSYDLDQPVKTPHRAALRRALLSAATVAVIILVAAGPDYLSKGQVYDAITLLGLVAVAQGWNLLAGYGGQVSLGVGAFVGTGSYAVTLLLTHTGVHLLVAVGLAAVAGALLAAIVAIPLFRLRGPYFAVGSLALSLAILAWMSNWSFSGATNPIFVPPLSIPLQNDLYRLAVAVGVIAMAAVWLTARSSFGLRLTAVRDNEDAASSLGVSALKVKVITLIISSAITALAGALVAIQNTSIEPNSAFGLTWTINAVVMTVVGGVGTVVGPLIGVFVIYYAIQQQLQSSPGVAELITGGVLILIIRFAPEGIWTLSRQLGANGWSRVRAQWLDRESS
jgi:branched-chain amino acid transport system permease protein